jgi:hypothetical protein
MDELKRQATKQAKIVVISDASTLITDAIVLTDGGYTCW